MNFSGKMYMLIMGLVVSGVANQADESMTIQIIDDIPQNPNRPGAGSGVRMGRTWEARVPYTIDKISGSIFGGKYDKNILLTDESAWSNWSQLIDALNIQIVNDQLRPYAQRLQEIIKNQLMGIVPRFIADLSSYVSADKHSFTIPVIPPRTMDTLSAIMNHDLQKQVHTELASIKRSVNSLRFADGSSEKQRADVMNAIGVVDGIVTTFENDFATLRNEYSRVARVLDYPRAGVKTV